MRFVSLEKKKQFIFTVQFWAENFFLFYFLPESSSGSLLLRSFGSL